MTGRVQTPRFTTSGGRPTGRPTGELYVNLADMQLGVVDAAHAAQDLIAIRYFSPTASYSVGNFVVNGVQIYVAIAPSSPGAFNAANWMVMGAQGPQGAAGSQGPAGGIGPQGVGILNQNKIINPDMRIDQRWNGASGTTQNAYVVDRWIYSASQASKGTWQRGAGPASLGYPYCLSFTSSSAYSAAGDLFYLAQPLEADSVSELAWGTPGAQPATLTFWVTVPAVGLTFPATFGGCIFNYAANRSYPFSYSIPTAATWTKITVTIPADTGGTWVMSGNNFALWVCFDLGTGATYRGPANAWASGNYRGANGTASTVAINGSSFNVTGVKFEAGNVATPFERPTLTKSMADCQRYYQKIALGYRTYVGQAGQVINAGFSWPQMRAVPTTILVTAGTRGNAGSVSFSAYQENSGFLQGTATAATDTFILNDIWSLSAEV